MSQFSPPLSPALAPALGPPGPGLVGQSFIIHPPSSPWLLSKEELSRVRAPQCNQVQKLKKSQKVCRGSIDASPPPPSVLFSLLLLSSATRSHQLTSETTSQGPGQVSLSNSALPSLHASLPPRCPPTHLAFSLRQYSSKIILPFWTKIWRKDFRGLVVFGSLCGDGDSSDFDADGTFPWTWTWTWI